MKVSKLLEVLEDCDPDARVIIAIQPNYPIECHVSGAVVREWYDDGGAAPDTLSDVIILQGDDIGRGNKEAWNA